MQGLPFAVHLFQQNSLFCLVTARIRLSVSVSKLCKQLTVYELTSRIVINLFINYN
jgi:hypothetical protein